MAADLFGGALGDDGAATVAALMSGPALPEPTPTPRATGPGLGLGLALCRAFVHRHGGTLVIQSRPGAGTNVTVSLPAAKEKLKETKAIKTEKSPSY